MGIPNSTITEFNARCFHWPNFCSQSACATNRSRGNFFSLDRFAVRTSSSFEISRELTWGLPWELPNQFHCLQRFLWKLDTNKTTRKKRSWRPKQPARKGRGNMWEKVVTTKTTRKKRSWRPKQPARKGRDDQNNPQEKVVATCVKRSWRPKQPARKGRGDQNNPQEKVVATCKKRSQETSGFNSKTTLRQMILQADELSGRQTNFRSALVLWGLTTQSVCVEKNAEASAEEAVIGDWLAVRTGTCYATSSRKKPISHASAGALT